MSEALSKAIMTETGDDDFFSSEEHDALVQAMQEVDWYDEEQRKAVADTVTKKLTEEIRKEDVTRFYSTTDRFKVGDTPEYTFQKGLKAYVHEVGTYAPRSHIIQRTLTVDTELVSVHPEMELSQLEAGRYGTVSSIRRMARDELMGRKNAYLWNTLVNSITSADSNYWTLSSPSDAVKANVLISGIDIADDASPRGIQAIVGRRSVLGFINNVSGYAETTKTKIDNGSFGAGSQLLGTFRGIPVVALHQYTDGYDVNRISATDIMIVAPNTTRLAVTENLRMLQDLNINDRTWHVHWSEKYGAFVVWPQYNYRINLT
jgi:hypothetical protein